MRKVIKLTWEKGFLYSSLFVDLLMLNISLLFTFYVCYWIFGLPFLSKSLSVWLSANIIYILFYITAGVYRKCCNLSLKTCLKVASKSNIYSGVFFILLTFLIKPKIESFFVVLIFIPLQYLFALIIRIVFSRLKSKLRKKGYGIRNTCVACYKSDLFQKFISYNIERFGYLIRGLLDIKQNRWYKFDNGKLYIVNQNSIERTMDSLKIQDVLILDELSNVQNYDKVIKLCKSKNIRVKIICPEFGNVMNNERIRDLVGISLLPSKRYSKSDFLLKRILDLLIAGASLIVLAIVFLTTILLVKLTSRGPLFFVQPRSLNGYDKSFNFYKFRSMFADADKQKELLLNRNITTGALFKDPRDPRVTPVGRIIRKLSIDELPQILSVIKGDMSMVGPRPLPVRDYDNICKEEKENGWCEYRAHAIPGITGLWQISGRSEIKFEEMVLLDIYYIENRSFLFDMEILLETLPAVITGRGAY